MYNNNNNKVQINNVNFQFYSVLAMHYVLYSGKDFPDSTYKPGEFLPPWKKKILC